MRPDPVLARAAPAPGPGPMQDIMLLAFATATDFQLSPHIVFSALAPSVLISFGLHYFYCHLDRAGPSYFPASPYNFLNLSLCRGTPQP